MIRLILISNIFLILFASCRKNQSIVHKADVIEYLNPKAIQAKISRINSEISFWENKLISDTGSFVYMKELAGLHLQLFRLTGRVESLVKCDSLMHLSSAKLKHSDPELLFNLVQYNIMQHRFKQAAFNIDSAEKRQGDKYALRLLQFDVYMELGRYSDAYQFLKSISNHSSFDYLIRKSKWEDYKGNLEGSIRLMEEALINVKGKNTNLYCWALSNLGDLYGHAGRINDAYAAYLDVLKLDPSDVYCLKGIARIAYVNDKNNSLAKQILFFIQEQCSFPDINLLLAEIAETENNSNEVKMHLDNFLTEVSRHGYGIMYNKYLIEILSESDSTAKQALNLAQLELKNRFTPETSDWVAWAYFNTGNYSEALKWTTSYVLGQTSEPQTLMHSAFILAANGRNSEARDLLKEALESSFELGPVAEKRIKELLNTL